MNIKKEDGQEKKSVHVSARIEAKLLSEILRISSEIGERKTEFIQKALKERAEKFMLGEIK